MPRQLTFDYEDTMTKKIQKAMLILLYIAIGVAAGYAWRMIQGF